MEGPSEKLDDLLGYLEENWNGIYGSRGLRDRIRVRKALVVVTSPVEKELREEKLARGWRQV